MQLMISFAHLAWKVISLQLRQSFLFCMFQREKFSYFHLEVFRLLDL